MLIQWLKPDFTFENENGCLWQLVREGYKQVNVIRSAPGSVRGGHYHRFNTETFYVVQGSFALTLWKDGQREEYEIKAGEMFALPSYVFHTFVYHEETLLVSLYSQGVELSETEKDIWTK